MSVTPSHAASALDALLAAANQMHENLEQYDDTNLLSSEDENQSENTIYDGFLNSIGAGGIHKMTNFSPHELERFYESFREQLLRVWNTGRGNRCRYSPFDNFFMTLTVLKNGGSWDFLAAIFKLKAPTFQRMITRFVYCAGPIIYDMYVKDHARTYTMEKLREDNVSFSNYPEARYATDVIFQQSNRPSGTLSEGRVFFSGKHHMYGFKTEVSVLPNGLAIGYTKWKPGSTSDIEIFRNNQRWHNLQSRKTEEELRIFRDAGELHETYPNNWAIICDKGYTGLSRNIRAIIPVRKPANGWLTVAQKLKNQNISADRIIVENFFGRLCSFQLYGTKWKWSEDNYDVFVQFGVATTNVHVSFHALRASDRAHFIRLTNRMLITGAEKSRKRTANLNLYRDRRRTRLFDAPENGDDSVSEDIAGAEPER